MRLYPYLRPCFSSCDRLLSRARIRQRCRGRGLRSRGLRKLHSGTRPASGVRSSGLTTLYPRVPPRGLV
eukprot:4940524-Prymnesium_polylepis.1